MVNKVNGNDYYDYSKLKMPDAADKPENGEKFSLNYQRAKEDEEDKDKKEKTGEGKEINAAGIGAKRTVMQSGVRLELSGSAPSSLSGRQKQTAEHKETGPGLFDTLRSWFNAFMQAAKAFFYKVWNDDTNGEDIEGAGVDGAQEPQDAGTVQGVDEGRETPVGAEEVDSAASEPERLTEEYLVLNRLESLKNPEEAAREQMLRSKAREKEIQNYLRSGNLEEVMKLVTLDGQKTMAKNSTLLTYYDRTGRITPLSASDQERILHGDRNVKKL